MASCTELRGNLEKALEIIRNQIAGPRQRDPWAHADRALTSLLLGHTSDEEDAWNRLRQLEPPAYVFGSTRKVVNDLMSATESAEQGAAMGALTKRLRAAEVLLNTAKERAAAS